MEREYVHQRQLFDKIVPLVYVNHPQHIDVQTTLGDFMITKKNCDPMSMKQIVLFLKNGIYKHRPGIYTDASKTGGSCGVGVFCPATNGRISLRLQIETCIMTAEMYAIDIALNYLEQQEILDAVLYTDSLSSCLMIESQLKEKKRNLVIQRIIEAACKLRTTLQWIPSHISIIGNDAADDLAKAGTTSNQILENGLFIKDALVFFSQQRVTNTNRWYTDYADEGGQR